MNHSAQLTAPHRFEAPTSREALRLVRERLGPDAMVLSSQVTATGVVIVAVAEVPYLPALPAAPALSPLMPSQSFTAPLAASQANTDSVLREIHAMRGMIEEQLASLVRRETEREVWQARPLPAEPSQAGAQRLPFDDPLRTQLLRVMLGAGLSPRLARSTLAAWPGAQLGSADTTNTQLAHAMAWLKTALVSQLPVLGDDDSLMTAGGVYALVGPTGVGKTTTTAKLAARCVMRFGAAQLALVTTDTFRIGAVEQLRIYGEILGVPVYAVQGAEELDGLLTQLRGKHMVLIDTVGMSQRDRAVADQIALLSATQRPVKRLLLLNAASHGDTLDEVVRAYQSVGTPGNVGADGARGAALAGCIFTKVDEAVHSGALIDIAIREQLQVHYVANGQQVPENLLLARAESLVDSLLAVRAPSAWMDVQDLPAGPVSAVSAAVAGSTPDNARQLLRALAHDAQALARTAAQLASEPLGYAATHALWHAATRGQEPTCLPGAAPEVTSATWLLAITGKSQSLSQSQSQGDDGHGAQPSVAYSTLMLSGKDGTPVLAPGQWCADAPDGTESAPDSSPVTVLHGQPVVHMLARPPRSEQIKAWAQAGVRWVAQGSASVRVQGAAPTLARVLKNACFGPAQATLFRRKAAWLALAEVEIQLLDEEPVAKTQAPRLRCVIKRINDAQGKALAHSFVICPLSLDVPAAQLVQWPVWRTEAEPYFKLLTQALAQPLAPTANADLHWQLAAQACITAYRLQRTDAAWADAARKLLAQLAGRPVRPSQAISGPTLLDGLGKFMALLDALHPDASSDHEQAQTAPAGPTQVSASATGGMPVCAQLA